MSAEDEAVEERIRVRAYYLWQADDCPQGRDQEYWHRARELIAIEDDSSAGRQPNPMTETGAAPGSPEPVEPSEAVDNQRERQQASRRRRRR